MNFKEKYYCGTCSQPYSLARLNGGLKGRIPLILACKHSICENCLRNMLKFSEPILCKICNTKTEVSPSKAKQLVLDEGNLKTVFPINLYILGDTSLQLSKQPVIQCAFQNLHLGFIKNNAKQQTLDLKFLNLGDVTKKCNECNSNSNNMCKQCNCVLCDNCFERIHSSFKALKDHVKQKITNSSQIITNLTNCEKHPDKTLEYYCEMCKKAACMNCMLIGTKECATHNIIPLKEKNNNTLADLEMAKEKANEIFLRLGNTLQTIITMLNSKNEGSLSNKPIDTMVASIANHFTKMHAILQMQEAYIMTQLDEIVSCETNSLESFKIEAMKNMEKIKLLLQAADNALEPDYFAKVNLCDLIKSLNQVQEIPWSLTKEEYNGDTALKFEPDTSIYATLENHAKLKGEIFKPYALLPTSEIKPGTEVPPVPKSIESIILNPLENMCRDVREVTSDMDNIIDKGPRYKSNSSLNSLKTNPSRQSSQIEEKEIEIYPSINAHQRTTSSSDCSVISNDCSVFSNSSQRAKPLEEGCHELVYISHINHPHDFYVQRSIYQPNVKELIKEFRKAAGLSVPKIGFVTEGKIFLGFSQLDEQWQRCRIIKADCSDQTKPTFKVFYIDFGETDDVTLDKLRILPPERITRPAPLALHCQLANCAPLKNEWTNDDTLLMQQIINNKQALMHVTKSLGASMFGLSLECELTTYEQNVNIADALVFHGRAKYTKKIKRQPRNFHSLNAKQKFFKNNMKSGEMEEVIITKIVSPDCLFARKLRMQDEYKSLVEDMNETYDIHKHEGFIYYPEVGMCVVCNITNYTDQVPINAELGDIWRRSIVTALPQCRKVSVSLVDSGHVVVVHWTAVRRIEDKHCVISKLAFQCHLCEVSPKNGKWTKGAKSLLEQYAIKPLTVMVAESREKRKPNNSVPVVLYRNASAEYPDTTVCINAELVKFQYAIATGSAILQYPSIITKETEKTSTLAKNVSMKKIETSLHKGPLKLEVNILSCQSPSLIYVSLISQETMLNELIDQMQKYYNNLPSNQIVSSPEWKEGDKCAAYYSLVKKWHRAQLIEVNNEQGTAKIFYQDLAQVEDVSLDKLQVLVDDFLGVRNGAIKCHLSGVVPAMGDIWPTISCEYLNELIESYKRHFITKHGEIKNKSLPIELWVYHVTSGGPLDPNVSEWRKLNNKIIEQGLGIPLKENGNTSEISDDTFSFLNNTDTMDDWLQLVHTEIKITDKDQNTFVHPEIEDEIGTRYESEPIHSYPCIFKGWLPVEKIPHQEFMAVPTFIDDNFTIYLFESSQEGTLELIKAALQSRFKNSELKPQDKFWTENQPCIALFDVDQNYYRGTILEVFDDDTCKVLFVDYGNVELCPVKHLRKSIVMMDIPIQASKCVLGSITPKFGKWEESTLDFIHKQVVMKQCLVKITSDKIDDCYNISLTIGKINIADLLVSLQYADYKSDIVDKEDFQTMCNNKQIVAYEPLNDSDPDFIIDDDNEKNYDLQNAAWYKLVEEEEQKKNTVGSNLSVPYPTYPTFSLSSTVHSFKCTVTTVMDETNAVLHVISEDEATQEKFDKISQDMQEEGCLQPCLDGVYENKACIALFSEDSKWYRAEVLEYDDDAGLIKVNYIDYGNKEVVQIENVREANTEWCSLPAQAFKVQFYGIKKADNVSTDQILIWYQDILFDDSLVAEIRSRDSNVLQVDLFNNQSTELIYQNLIDDGVLKRES